MTTQALALDPFPRPRRPARHPGAVRHWRAGCGVRPRVGLVGGRRRPGRADRQLRAGRAARLRRPHRPRARRRPAGRPHQRREDRRRADRSHPLLRGPRRPAGGARRTHHRGGGRNHPGAHQRLRQPEPRLGPRHGGAARRPHQPHRGLAAARRHLHRPVRGVRRRGCGSSPGRSTPSCRRASTSSSADRSSRPRPRSGWPASWVATWSACPPRSRPSRPARPGCRCSASRWSPTWPRASRRSR